MECAKNTNVLVLFALVNCQGCDLVVNAFVCKSLLDYLLCCKTFTSGGTSFRILFRVPISDVFFFRVHEKKIVSCNVPSFAQVWLHYFYYRTLRQSLCSWSGFIFAKIWYGVLHLNFSSTASQNLIPNFFGLLAIYCINLQQALVGNNCLFTLIFCSSL